MGFTAIHLEGDNLNVINTAIDEGKGLWEIVKDALWSIEDNKAPGPDGYSAKFFKATWEETGSEVCSAVKEFFSNGKIL